MEAKYSTLSIYVELHIILKRHKHILAMMHHLQ